MCFTFCDDTVLPQQLGIISGSFAVSRAILGEFLGDFVFEAILTG